MRGTALVIALAMMLLACAPAGAALPTEPAVSPSSSVMSPMPSPTDAPMGIDTDEPCTRTIDGGTGPAAIGFLAEDLERMGLTAADFPLAASELQASVDEGYLGNSEMESIRVRTPTICGDNERFGRINGYLASYDTVDSDYLQRHTLSSWVHLFWDGDGARSWSEAFVDGLQEAVGTPGGPTRLDVQPIEGLPAGSSLITYEGAGGARTWAVVVDGPVVGWVVDEHDTLAPDRLDLAALAQAMASRIEAVTSEVSGRPRDGLDVAGLASAPLRLADYGERYADLAWDADRSGLTDALTPSCGPVAAEGGHVPTIQPVSGASATYAPPSGTEASEIVRVSSSVMVMADADEASAALADLVADREEDGGQRFEPGPLGDEVVGIVTPPHSASGGCEILYTETLVATRIGDVLATVAIQDRNAIDQTAHVAALGATLADRVTALQAETGGACPHCLP